MGNPCTLATLAKRQNEDKLSKKNTTQKQKR